MGMGGKRTLFVLMLSGAAACGAGDPPATGAAVADAEAPDATPGVRVETVDALVPGTDFHATGQVPCATATGQPMAQCDFGVRREGGGTAAVTITKPDGRIRTIFFENGEAVGYDMSQADPGAFAARRDNDLYLVTIGEERYEIPDIVVLGD